MTGPEHFREAEKLAEEARFAIDEPENTIWTFGTAIQAAQVHAQLALADAFLADLQAPGSVRNRAADTLREIREVLAAFDWERDDRQYALERIERIAGVR